MNALTVIFQEAYRAIPEEILSTAFGQSGACNPMKYATIDQCLNEYIWKPITLRHINLNVGRDKLIVLNPRWKVRTRPMPDEPLFGSCYHIGHYLIPPEAREYSNLVNVERISDRYPSSTMGIGGQFGNFANVGNTLASLAQAGVNSRTYQYNAVIPEVNLLGGNIVEVAPDEFISGTLELRCTLEYNPELTNADRTFIYHAARLFLCDLKVFLYNKLNIKTDKVSVQGGFEIGSFRSTIDEYANANAEREELITVMRGQSYTDPKLFRRLVTALL